jgi:hypothetical protein
MGEKGYHAIEHVRNHNLLQKHDPPRHLSLHSCLATTATIPLLFGITVGLIMP